MLFGRVGSNLVRNVLRGQVQSHAGGQKLQRFTTTNRLAMGQDKIESQSPRTLEIPQVFRTTVLDIRRPANGTSSAMRAFGTEVHTREPEEILHGEKFYKVITVSRGNFPQQNISAFLKALAKLVDPESGGVTIELHDDPREKFLNPQYGLPLPLAQYFFHKIFWDSRFLMLSKPKQTRSVPQ